jgi:hypothetical protein
MTKKLHRSHTSVSAISGRCRSLDDEEVTQITHTSGSAISGRCRSLDDEEVTQITHFW